MSNSDKVKWETSAVVDADGDAQWDICEEGGGDMIADLSYCGTSDEQEERAKFIVSAWNSNIAAN